MFRISPTKFLVLTALSATFILSVTFWISCSDFAFKLPQRRLLEGPPFEDIECQINAERIIACKKQGSEVYIPFSFIQNYFEIYGSMNGERFDWYHSHGKINHPKGVYNPRGVFMYFDNYNVEARDRVKCISGTESVPISTQWNVDGYFYATQIAQFGLTHYSKNLTEAEPRRHIIEDGDDIQADWELNGNSIKRTYLSDKSTNCVNFATVSGSSISLNVNLTLDLVLSLDILFYPNASLIVRMQNRDEPSYNIIYEMSDTVIDVQSDNIIYGLGRKRAWRSVTRDLFIDFQKGLQFANEKRRKMRRSEVRLLEISVHGTGNFDNLTVATTNHMAHFYDAAEWFVKHQNRTTGGWSIPVKRKLGSGFMELPKGWYSAMSQGHAISLLARAYYSTGERRYLKAAVNALKLFKIPSYQGGIMATFLGKYIWFEEYPTSPPSYVLNGFIYSLIGLYDLNATSPQNYSVEAGQLFDNGMMSLKKMLTLYDTGSGSTYDLRHFSLGIAPNLARWDYHATHVNQLLLLATIDKDPIISQTAERWKDYMNGVRAQHN